MEIYSDLKDIKYYPNLVISLGNFDGIHLGHQKLIRRTIEIAQEIGGIPAVFTFDPHPLQVLKPNYSPYFLLPAEEKVAILRQKGTRVLFNVEFTPEIATMEPNFFLRKIVKETLQAKGVVVGYNYSFGQGGRGNSQTLREMSNELNLMVEVVPPVTVGGIEVSSTLIRKMLIDGRVEEATRFLGYYPYYSGFVVKGRQLGRQLGFPTANLEIKPGLVIPQAGVYITRIYIEGKGYYGVANIGCRPTLQVELPHNLEVHILGFEKDIYGTRIRVEFIKRLRKEKCFANLEDLKGQILFDVCEARKYIDKLPQE